MPRRSNRTMKGRKAAPRKRETPSTRSPPQERGMAGARPGYRMGHRGMEKPLVIFRNLPVVLRHLRGGRPRAEVASGSGIAAEHLAVLEYRPGRPLPKMTC